MSEYLKRGNMLWEGSRMFLPEHKQALNRRQKQQQKISKPVLDEQQLAQINETICEAMAENRTLSFMYYDKGEYNLLTGNIDYIDEANKELRIADHFGGVQKMKMHDVIDLFYD
jgi:hypothetical protein